MLIRRRAVLPVALVGVLALSACGQTSEPSGASSGGGGKLTVMTSIYPLQYITARIAGDHATVELLTPAGTEPHDLELTPKQVASVSDADMVVYAKGFQPAVDDAVSNAPDRGFDVAPSARLTLALAEEEGHSHAEESHSGEATGEHAAETVDPHFWLDPTRLADVADAVAKQLGERSPDAAATFTANAKAVREDLAKLDASYSTGLATCTNRTLVTSHAAFGYLADRYKLTQRGITGLDPETEPDAKALAEVTDFVKQNKVATVYYETLVSPAVAQTVARDTGAKTAVLDPLEGLAAGSTQTYLTVMQTNLSTLRTGQQCS